MPLYDKYGNIEHIFGVTYVENPLSQAVRIGRVEEAKKLITVTLPESCKKYDLGGAGIVVLVAPLSGFRELLLAGPWLQRFLAAGPVSPIPGVALTMTGILAPRCARLGEDGWDSVALPVPGDAVRPLPPPERGEGR